MKRAPTGPSRLLRDLRGFVALLGGHLSGKRPPELYAVIVEWLNTPRWSTNLMLRLIAFTIHVRRGARSLRLALRTRWSRLAFLLRPRPSLSAGGETPLVKSMLCPTRNRTEKVQRFVASVHRTCARPGDVEILFYVDDDDPALDAYARLIERLRARYPDFRAVELVVGPPISVSKSWNTLADRCRGDLLMMANDDQLYVDYGWDRRLDDYVRAAPDDVFAMFFEDGQYPPDGGDFPIVSRRWYETLGYFTPGIFEFWYNEAWIFDVANRLQRITRIPKILVEHLHYSDYKSVLDETYKRHRLNFEKADRDRRLFEGTEADRQAAADKLRPLMSQ
ncbi:MAG: glycosyltransferase family 2 protein [Pseudomonadota bacterium]